MAVELVNLTALLVTIIMLKSGELAFNTPLSAMVLRGFSMTIDQVRSPPALAAVISLPLGHACWQRRVVQSFCMASAQLRLAPSGAGARLPLDPPVGSDHAGGLDDRRPGWALQPACGMGEVAAAGV